MILAALALATLGQAEIPPTDPALTAEIKARDAEFFGLFFEGCDPKRVEAMLAPDFEMYHDKGGLVTRSAAPFVAQYAQRCAERARPDAWRSRRALIAGSLHVEAIPGFGAIEEGDHDFYERQGDGAERKVGTAHFVQLWQHNADGWRLSRVFSYSHRPPS